MNQLLLGAAIASLRKKRKMTQAALADILNVSNKTVSKWETGLSSPEIFLLPKLASAFGVTVDYLLSGEYNGIAIVGNVHIDRTSHLDADYRSSLLANTTAAIQHIAGCTSTVALNLAKIDPSVPLSVFGCVGNDDNGQRILSQLQRYNIKTGGISTVSADTGTNHILVDPDRKSRFLLRSFGANALLDPADIDIANLSCQLIHFGRLSLFPHFWDHDDTYGCKLARVLHALQQAGIQTSISLLGNIPTPKKEQMASVFKYCDYILLSAPVLTALCVSPVRPSAKDKSESYLAMMQQILDQGVQEKVFMFIEDHTGFCLSRNGSLSSSRREAICSSGATHRWSYADDLISGCLYGLYNTYPDTDILDFALGVSAASILYKTSNDGMLSKKKILQLIPRYRISEE